MDMDSMMEQGQQGAPKKSDKLTYRLITNIILIFYFYIKYYLKIYLYYIIIY